MSKITKAADEILEKMSFEDYKKPKKTIKKPDPWKNKVLQEIEQMTCCKTL